MNGRLRFVALLLLATAPAAAEPDGATDSAAEAPLPSTIRLTSGEWEPWTSEYLPHYGIANRIVSEAFAKAGIRVEFGFFPWARAYELAKTEAWDGTVAWIPAPEREAEFLFSESIFDGKTVFFHLASRSFSWTDFDDLAGLRVGTTVGYAYGPAFARAVAAVPLTVDTGPSDEANLRKLLNGRVDLVPLDEFVGLALIRKLFGREARQITYHPHPVSRSGNHLLIRKSHPQAARLIAAFDRALNQVSGLPPALQYVESNY